MRLIAVAIGGGPTHAWNARTGGFVYIYSVILLWKKVRTECDTTLRLAGTHLRHAADCARWVVMFGTIEVSCIATDNCGTDVIGRYVVRG